jgi:hypothetical protein
MKGTTKGIGIATVLLAALLIAAVIAPAMGAYEYGPDDMVDRLVHDLEDAVASYNEAATDGCPEDAANYTEDVDRILTELEVLGIEAEFTVTSENHGMATIDVSVVPIAEQNRTHGHSVSANEEQLEIIRQLWGQNITIGEYMEKVMPEVLVDKPEELVKHLYATKMGWPDIPKPALESAGEGGAKWPIVVNTGSDMDAEWPDIDFSSSSRVWLPHPWYKLPYMSVNSCLWYKDGNNNMILKSSEFKEGSKVYKVEASDSYSASIAGNYCVTGAHYMLAPPDHTPPDAWDYTSTDWSYVSP